MHRTSVEEAAVDEDAKPQRRNDDIRAAGEGPHVLLYAPAVAKRGPDHGEELPLRRGSRRPNPRHDLASELRGEAVSH